MALSQAELNSEIIARNLTLCDLGQMCHQHYL